MDNNNKHESKLFKKKIHFKIQERLRIHKVFVYYRINKIIQFLERTTKGK